MNTRRVSRRRTRRPSPRELEGGTSAEGLRVAVICSRWNSAVTEKMLESCLAWLEFHGAGGNDVTVIKVPGAFELPGAAAAALRSDRPDAVVVLGAIVRGETTHHAVLARAVSAALAELSTSADASLGFGLLTCDSLEQAGDRVEKGAEAAQAAVEMANLRRGLDRAAGKRGGSVRDRYVTERLRIQTPVSKSSSRSAPARSPGRRSH